MMPVLGKWEGQQMGEERGDPRRGDHGLLEF
jgi:hypothetical protein